MEEYKELDDLLIKANELYGLRADGVDYLSRRAYNRMDKLILRDFKRCYKAFNRQDKLKAKQLKKKQAKQKKELYPTIFTRFFAFIMRKCKSKLKKSRKSKK